MESDIIIVGDGEVVKVVGAWEQESAGCRRVGGGWAVNKSSCWECWICHDFSFYLYDVVLSRNLSSQHTV